MENNEDELLLFIIDMLKNPDNYHNVSIESICLTLEILHNRIMKIDSSILNNPITQEEYEKYFEELLSTVKVEGIDELIDEIKDGYKNMGDKDEN